MKFIENLAVATTCVFLFLQITIAVVSVEEYCDKFPKSLRPMICLLNENVLVPINSSRTTTRRLRTTTWRPHHPHQYPPQPPLDSFGIGHGEGWYQEIDESSSEEEDGEEEDAPIPSCSCDLTCYPPPGSMTANTTDDTFGEDLLCKPCGNNCPVNTAVTPICSCAAVGSALTPPESLWAQTCSCSVTCAPSPWENEDPFCIYNITGLQTTRDTTKPVDCECCKSKAAEHNEHPDFVCVCQRI